MRFWDASAVLPLLVAEPPTPFLQRLVQGDADMVVWWATKVECASALARLERDEMLHEAAATEAFERLSQLASGWHEVEATEAVREAAIRFLRVHALRAADALQLAAAFVASEGRPRSLELITLDDRLASAARKEGFVLIASPEGSS